MLVPAGRVTTYGAIASYLGSPGAARMVGWAMNQSHTHPEFVPAHRVVNRVGLLTGKHHFQGKNLMQELLEKVIRDGYPANSSDWRFHDAWVTEYWDRSVDWIWWSAAAVLVIVIDAYVDAHLDDMRFEVSPRSTADGVGLQFVFRY